MGGDLVFATGLATVSGNVTGSIEGHASTYTRTGTVGGTEDVSLSQPSSAPPVAPGGPGADALRQFVVVVLFGALGLWLLPRGLRAADAQVRRRPLVAFGAGLASALGFVALLVVLLVAMIALAVAFGLLTLWALVATDVVAWLLASVALTLAFLIAAAFLADAIVGLALARFALPRMAIGRWTELALLALGAAVVVIVTSLPIIGPWARALVMLVGLGALTLAGWGAWRGRRAPQPPAVVAPAPPVSA